MQKTPEQTTNASTNQGDRRHYRSIFISDTHLGTRGCQSELLVEFLKGHSCDRLYLVGDIIDGWKMKTGIYWPQSHSNVLRRILTLAKRGTQVVLVAGNHDEFLRRYTPLSLGNIELVDEAEHITADGRRLLVVHGDEFDVITRYHRWVAFLGDYSYSLLLQLNTLLNAVRRRYGFGYWSLSAYLKQRVKRAVSFIGDYENAVARACRQRDFDGVVCGHIHNAEISQIDGLEYMNCGDWVESCTALAEDASGQFYLIRWADLLADTRAPDLVDFPAPVSVSAFGQASGSNNEHRPAA